MKGVFTKVVALLLIVWYSMSIIGFGVHTCSGSGESFVVTFVEGFSCEDVHPEHHCTKGSCCPHSHGSQHDVDGVCVKSKPCCSSDYQVLSLTGVMSDEKNNADNPGIMAYNCPCLSVFDLHADSYNVSLMSCSRQPGASPGRMPDVQSLLSVWRI